MVHRYLVALAALAALVALVLVTLSSRAPAGERPSEGASGTARPAASGSTLAVCLLPLGDHDRYLMRRTARGIEHLFGFTVSVLPGQEMPDKAYYKPRKRWRADEIVEHIAENVVPESDCFAVIGFTALDISTTKGKHKDWGILGLAIIGGNAGVVSSYRMTRRKHRGKKVSRRLAAKRAVKVTNHELGHVLGLDHDDREKGCLMNDAGGTIRTVDRESGLLCAASRRFIERTHGITLPARPAIDWGHVLAGD